MKLNYYKRQLRQEATDAHEAVELSALARRVSQLKLPELSSEAKARIAGELGFANRRSAQPWMLAAGAAAAIALVSVVTLAQYSRPGSPLYSVKYQTNRLQEFIHPEASKSPLPASDDKNGSSAGEHRSGSDDPKRETALPTPGINVGGDKGGATSGDGTPGGTLSPSGGSGTSGGDGTSGGPGPSGGGDGTSGGSGTSGGDGTSGGSGH